MSSILLSNRFDCIRHKSVRLYNRPNIYRYSYSDRLRNSFNSLIPIPRLNVPCRYNSFSHTYKDSINAIYDITRFREYKLIYQIDSIRDSILDAISSRYNQKSKQYNRAKSYCDAIQFISGYGYLNNRFDVILVQQERIKNLRDSIANFFYTKFKCRFNIGNGKSKYLVRQRFDTLQYFTKERLRGINQLSVAGKFRIPNKSDFIFSRDELTISQNLFAYKYDLLDRNCYLGSGRFDSPIIGLPSSKASLLFDVASIGNALLKFGYQAFVKSGWRIIVRNLLTNEIAELGFIDADSATHSLTDISLPNGDYEISVLTSSLFWQDTIDLKNRTFSINDDSDNDLSLPLIYNLRSSILNNVTIIEWSANQVDNNDCIFGIWYSSDSPVDINRQPDSNIFYDSSQTEYRTTLSQREPTYITIAVIQAGNNPIVGKAHELFLDWSQIPPHAPDDVVVID
ncbi:MAG: hypothetical protein LBB88_02005 [Planctomycetaceae bacterium]|jgi:hypothetical protein|nr:hypothetical protein [Planctomycetaceae bacterium]